MDIGDLENAYRQLPPHQPQVTFGYQNYSTGIANPEPKKPDFVPDLRSEIKEWLKDALV